MTHESHEFDREYWERHWSAGGGVVEVNPHLIAEVADLAPGTAIEAGCGAGTEAIWLAARGWRVTGADISAQALDVARARSTEAGIDVAWVEADLTTWAPPEPADLVTTHYAHPSIPALDFVARLAGWVAPGGTLLVVGHLHDGHHPGEASVRSADVAARLTELGFEVVTADERTREVAGHGRLADVVVRARRP